MDRTGLSVIAEAKTRVVHTNPEDDPTVYLHFKDEITAAMASSGLLPPKGDADWASRAPRPMRRRSGS